MLKTKTVTGNLPKAIESQRLNNKTLMLSSQQMGWNGIQIEQCQNLPISVETELPALPSHWLILPLGHPGRLIQTSGDRPQESIFQKGDSLLVPASQSSSWRCQGSKSSQTELHIHLQLELISQVAQAAEMNTERLDLVYRFAKQDLQLQHIAMLLLTELHSDGMMGQLYVESLTQALAIHLLRHYSEVAQIITPQNRSLTHTQLQQAIDYIHTHLGRDLSLAELASVINISPRTLPVYSNKQWEYRPINM